MIAKSVTEITFEDIQALLGRVRESKTIEFKRQLAEGKAGALQALAGVTGLANTGGGDFVIGVEERGGLATAAPGIHADDVDAYARTLDQVLRSNVEPPLPPFDIQPIAAPDGRWVIVVRTPRSWIGPHRVTSNNHFYLRTSSATVPMDVADLRMAFGLRDSGVDRIEAFRRERLARITAGQAAIRLAPRPVLVIHLAPLPSFANRDLVDIARTIQQGAHMPVPPTGLGGYARVNLHGVYNFPGDEGDGTTGYGQLFRSGAYEGTNVASIDGEAFYFPSAALADMIVGSVQRYLRLQEHYGFGFPTVAMVSFCNAATVTLRMPTELGSGYYPTLPLGEEVVSFPEILIERADVDVPTMLRPLLNMIWNGFGWPECTRYDGQGNWKGP